MLNELLGVIRYEDAKDKWVWIANHYDLHLSGLLRFGGELCRFETHYHRCEVSVYRLTQAEKLKWLARKKLFELCVGYHWSYPERKHGARFCGRRPEWLHKMLFRLYYAWCG